VKKGCFIKLIIILTILVAGALYVVQNKFDDFILKPGKKFLMPVIKSDINKNLQQINPSPERDSLIVLLNNYFVSLKENKNINSEHIKEIVEAIQSAFKDKKIDKNELSEISKLINSGRPK
jgi:hypothetical protein